jgi:hypothetical protein
MSQLVDIATAAAATVISNYRKTHSESDAAFSLLEELRATHSAAQQPEGSGLLAEEAPSERDT